MLFLVSTTLPYLLLNCDLFLEPFFFCKLSKQFFMTGKDQLHSIEEEFFFFFHIGIRKRIRSWPFNLTSPPTLGGSYKRPQLYFPVTFLLLKASYIYSRGSEFSLNVEECLVYIAASIRYHIHYVHVRKYSILSLPSVE